MSALTTVFLPKKFKLDFTSQMKNHNFTIIFFLVLWLKFFNTKYNLHLSIEL